MFIKWSAGDQPCLAKCVVDGQTHGRPFFQVGLRHGNPLFSFSLFSSICGYKIWELPFLPHLFSAFCRFRKKKELFWEMVAFFRWLPAFFRMFGCCIFQLLDSTFFFRSVAKRRDAALSIPLSEAHWRSFSTEAFETVAVRSQKPALCCRDWGNCF